MAKSNAATCAVNVFGRSNNREAIVVAHVKSIRSIYRQRRVFFKLSNISSSLAIAGEDFCLIAADTRQSEGYNINTRYAPKTYKLTDKAVLATSGFHADGLAMAKQITAQLQVNFHLFQRIITFSLMLKTMGKLCQRLPWLK